FPREFTAARRTAALASVSVAMSAFTVSDDWSVESAVACIAAVGALAGMLGVTAGDVGAMAASGMTKTTRAAAAIARTRQRVSALRGAPGSRIASKRPSKSERRAIASAALGT